MSTNDAMPDGARWSDDDPPTLVLSGEVDLFVVQRLRAGDLPPIVDRVDASAVTFIDSSGLSFLIRLAGSASERGTTLELISPSEPVAKLIEITGTKDLFAVV